jgi:hypothetical protein
MLRKGQERHPFFYSAGYFAWQKKDTADGLVACMQAMRPKYNA